MTRRTRELTRFRRCLLSGNRKSHRLSRAAASPLALVIALQPLRSIYACERTCVYCMCVCSVCVSERVSVRGYVSASVQYTEFASMDEGRQQGVRSDGI